MEPSHFLYGIKNAVRRHISLWKLKENVMEVPVLSLNATIFIVFKFVLSFFWYLEIQHHCRIDELKENYECRAYSKMVTVL